MDNPETLSKMVWRRISQPMPDWVIFLPLLFAVGVALLLLLYRRERRTQFFIWAGAALAVFAALYLPPAFMLRKAFPWIVVVAPLLAVALVYVGLMYVKDSRSIHPLWASFLGLLRCLVYGILAVMFFLPGCQHFEQVKTHAKTILIIDVSMSMDTLYREPATEEKAENVPTRKKEVLRLLTEPLPGKGDNLLKLILDKTPLTVYRFGGILDEKEAVTFTTYDQAINFKWEQWLNPKRGGARKNEIDLLLDGTNVFGALERAWNLEQANPVQAMIVFSDGLSNSGLTGSASGGEQDAFQQVIDNFHRELPKAVKDTDRPVPYVVTVGVGAKYERVKVEIKDLLTPAELRPEDKFPINVILKGEGLAGQKTKLELELFQWKDKEGRELTDAEKEKRTFLLTERDGDGGKKETFKEGTFRLEVGNPTAEFEFKDLELLKLAKIELTGNKTQDEALMQELEGIWRVTVKVPKHEKENFKDKFHVRSSDFKVLGKKIRVLLIAGGPQRDYQLVRTLFFRETQEKRMEFAVYFQAGAGSENIDQDVPPKLLLHRFPDRIEVDEERPYSSLSSFDVVVAFDPDWTALKVEQRKLLGDWVNKKGGGFIFVAGPINTVKLAMAGEDKDDREGLGSLQSILPVRLRDPRDPGDGGVERLTTHDPTRPWILNFEKEARKEDSDFDFLRLDERVPGPVTGWDKFFYGPKGKPAEIGEGPPRPRRGFHWFAPVESLQPTATVLATFAGHPDLRIKIREEDSDPPFIVTMRAGRGKSVFIGSGETWRLRLAKEVFHDRFWINLARFVSSGITEQKKFGFILMQPNARVGFKELIQAEIRGEDMKPLPAKTRVTAEIVYKPAGGDEEISLVDLKPKRGTTKDGEETGLFEGLIDFAKEGKHTIKIQVPGTTQYLPEHVVDVTRPNQETDDARLNFPALFDLSSPKEALAGKLDAATSNKLTSRLTPPEERKKAKPRLYLPLKQADILHEALVKLPPFVETVKTEPENFLSKGLETDLTINSALLCVLIPFAVGLLGFAILLFIGHVTGGLLFLAGFALLSLGIGGFWLMTDFHWPELPVDFSFVLITVVTLLAAEWLTRKLLRLA